MIATGSSPRPADRRPGELPYDKSDAVWADAVPASLVVLGGGPVGAGLAQFFSRMGAAVTIVETNDRLLESSTCGGRRALGSSASRARGSRYGRSSASPRSRPRPRRGVALDPVDQIDAARLLVLPGRRPNVDDLGLGGARSRCRGGTVDDHLGRGTASGRSATWPCAANGVTHSAGTGRGSRASNIAGINRTADYRAVPAGVLHRPAGRERRHHGGRRRGDRELH